MFGPQTRLLAYGLSAILLAAVLSWLFLAGRSAGIRHDAKRSAPIIAGLQGDLGQCRANLASATQSVAAQNAAVSALKTEADRMSAASEKAVSEAQKGRESAEKRAAKLLANPPAGIDACARAVSAFDAVKGALQ